VRVDLWERLPEDWRAAMAPYLDQRLVSALEEFLSREYTDHTVYPPLPDLFRAFRLSPLARTTVLILGQDPYHRPGQAHGLSFSVPAGVPPPPSLRTIFKELEADLGIPRPATGDLTGWARQGVLLLNAVLTVRAGQPRSHAGKGWEQFTDAAIRVLSDRSEPMVFVLWGAYARRKTALIDQDRHVVLTAAHPSPLAGDRFRGSRPFSAINEALRRWGRPPVDWAALDTGD